MLSQTVWKTAVFGSEPHNFAQFLSIYIKTTKIVRITIARVGVPEQSHEGRFVCTVIKFNEFQSEDLNFPVHLIILLHDNIVHETNKINGGVFKNGLNKLKSKTAFFLE